MQPKSGDKRITDVGVGRNAWGENLDIINFHSNGLYIHLTVEIDNYTNSQTLQDVALLFINNTTVAYIGRHGTQLLPQSNTVKDLHLSEKQTCAKVDHAI